MAAHNGSSSYQDGPNSNQHGPGEDFVLACWHDRELRKHSHLHLQGGHQ